MRKHAKYVLKMGLFQNQVAKLPVESGEDFAKWLLTDFNYNNKTVMVAPAECFYATKGLVINEIRLSYCLNTTALKDAWKF